MLTWLWKRLSNGGAEGTISGRALRRFPEREVVRLLRARVLIEHRKADAWPVCLHCDCGLDARPIRMVGGQLRACCPRDNSEDLALNEQDLRRFSIDPEKLAAEIAASGGVSGRANRILEGIWSVGTTPTGVAVVLCRAAHHLESPGTLLAIRAAIGNAGALLIADAFDASAVLHLKEAGFSTAGLDDVLVSDNTGSERLQLDRLIAAARPTADVAGADAEAEPRLQIFRAQRVMRLDGRGIVLSMTAFDAFCGAAEKVVEGKIMLTYQELCSRTNRTNHRDVINELRDQLERHGLPREQTFELVETVHGRGITIGLAKSDIVIRD
jgi:hypothetical protein